MGTQFVCILSLMWLFLWTSMLHLCLVRKYYFKLFKIHHRHWPFILCLFSCVWIPICFSSISFFLSELLGLIYTFGWYTDNKFQYISIKCLLTYTLKEYIPVITTQHYQEFFFSALCYFTPLSFTLYHLIIQKLISIHNGIVIAVPEWFFRRN